MSALPAGAEQALAAMSAAEVTELLARVRPSVEGLDPLDQADAALDDGGATPMEKAAAALRKSRGLDRRPAASREQAQVNAANAMRNYARGGRNS